MENESSEDMSKRIETLIANELDVPVTNFTVNDKLELEKRLSCEMKVIKQPQTIRTNIDPGLIEMASKVKDVLPDVPLSVIYKDLGALFNEYRKFSIYRSIFDIIDYENSNIILTFLHFFFLARTRNVDLTVANFLEGLIKYTPEKMTSSSSDSLTSTTSGFENRKSSLNATVGGSAQPSTSFNTSSKTFHKSAQERMISFQERKLRLIQNARQRYIEKHALNVMNSS